MVQLGIYYFDQDTGFPAVVIKSLGQGRVLVRVWTDSDDITLAAETGSSPGTQTFVPSP